MQKHLVLKSALITIGLAVAAQTRAANFEPVPLTPSSFTYAIVISSNAPKILPYCITATTGSGVSEGDNTLFEQGYYEPPGTTGYCQGFPRTTRPL